MIIVTFSIFICLMYDSYAICCSILRNNSFCGNIPEEIGELKELEELDLGYNNFSGPFPSDIGNNHSLSIL